MVQLSAHVTIILNCTKLTIARLIQRYRVTGRTADRPRSGRPRVTTANEDRHRHILHLRNRFLTVTSSAATGLGHVTSHHTTPSTTTAWYQGLSTIQRNIIDEATSTFTLGTSVSTLVTSELVTCSFFLMIAGSRYSELMAGLGYSDVQEREQLRAVFRRPYGLVVDLWWFLAVSVANSGQTLLSLTEISPHSVT